MACTGFRTSCSCRCPPHSTPLPPCSMRPDLIGESYASALAELQDNVVPFDTPTAWRIIESELGAPVEDIFSSITPQPIASASLGQVRAGPMNVCRNRAAPCAAVACSSLPAASSAQRRSLPGMPPVILSYAARPFPHPHPTPALHAAGVPRHAGGRWAGGGSQGAAAGGGTHHRAGRVHAAPEHLGGAACGRHPPRLAVSRGWRRACCAGTRQACGGQDPRRLGQGLTQPCTCAARQEKGGALDSRATAASRPGLLWLSCSMLVLRPVTPLGSAGCWRTRSGAACMRSSTSALKPPMPPSSAAPMPTCPLSRVCTCLGPQAACCHAPLACCLPLAASCLLPASGRLQQAAACLQPAASAACPCPQPCATAASHEAPAHRHQLQASLHATN